MPKARHIMDATKVINGKRYKGLQRYGSRLAAQREAAKWVREPGVSAKITGPDDRDGFYTVWVRMKKKGER
ncbi:MAG: hypothetical protein PHQ43_09030 [Dehalococcoidales bacterium]|nr:hypothetical protein [Dehalococcoidales bacterium]